MWRLELWKQPQTYGQNKIIETQSPTVSRTVIILSCKIRAKQRQYIVVAIILGETKLHFLLEEHSGN